MSEATPKRRVMAWLVSRLREPSSYSALAIASASLGYAVPEGVVQGVAMVGAGIATLAAFALPEVAAK